MASAALRATENDEKLQSSSFYTPSSFPGSTPQAPSCPIDLVHLSRQTMGDRELEQEVLTLFERQAKHIGVRLAALESSPDHGTRADLAHKLKGSARAVGAFAVASAAENYEHGARAGLLRAMDLRQLTEALEEALGALRDLNG